MKRIALIGQGGHAKVIKDMIYANKYFKIIAFFDDKYRSLDKREEIYYGPISSIPTLMKEVEFKLIIAIGNNVVRKKIVEQLHFNDEYYEIVIHHTAVISESATIGRGTVIMPNVTINADTTIGSHVIVNTASVVEHDNCIGDFVHIGPNATLTGTVTIDDGTQIGAGATIIPNLIIGNWSMIGAGATVIHNIPSGCTAVGLPAKIIK
ncbi:MULTISPECIES: acetyltransferase [Bacillus]|uniref:acetyltransferase n=1 Tax=Bacillus TaxID=1386 RepID=UPI00077AFE40|nr:MULTISPECIES: acetyltransferase [Bacillus cereus group]KXY71825.1 acetyltransferase [Bacillus cereus]MBG9937315.1 acetyltransferase [Bacillus tropicus]MED2997357.1 acetyltransferase [Bacillus tropicus]OTY57477.1 acetyltransferase [Bacillus thuringiensis serovar graciosensis]